MNNEQKSAKILPQYCVVEKHSVGVYEVYNQITRDLHSEYYDEDVAHMVCAGLNHASRQLTPLETELLAIVRSMSAKLYEAAEFAKHWVPQIPEAERDFTTNAEYSDYLKKFPVMAQSNYR